MKVAALFVSLVVAVFLSAPTLAQETGTSPALDQYGSGESAYDAILQSVEDAIREQGRDANGAEAYAAALEAAREAGADDATARVVAAGAVAEVSEEGPGITVLPETGGPSLFVLAGGVVLAAGLLARRVFR